MQLDLVGMVPWLWASPAANLRPPFLAFTKMEPVVVHAFRFVDFELHRLFGTCGKKKRKWKIALFRT